MSFANFACRLFVLACLASAGPASAALSPIGPGAFAASDPLVDYGSGTLFAPVDGKTIGGVEHGFKVGGNASADATIDIVPGALDFVFPASIEGASGGVLSLRFGSAQARLGFGWALSAADGGTIELFDSADVSLGLLSFSGTADSLLGAFGFVSGFAGVASTDPFVRADIRFNGAGRFAFDNLRFGDTIVNQTPEPGSLALLLSGAVLLAARRRIGPAG